MALTPHGPGFSFVDRYKVIESKKKIRASKWLDPNNTYFKDHFPGNPLMPGVLLVECAAQSAGILWQNSEQNDSASALFLAQINQFRISKPVLPGQTLEINVSLDKDFGTLAQFSAELAVEGIQVASGSITLSRSCKD
jgi:3-hydroxyacyl-[acyl-carrier-protein] dehydratase